MNPLSDVLFNSELSLSSKQADNEQKQNVPHSQFIRFNVPSGFLVGLATKPYNNIDHY
jgi:hypothetical protein